VVSKNEIAPIKPTLPGREGDEKGTSEGEDSLPKRPRRKEFQQPEKKEKG